MYCLSDEYMNMLTLIYNRAIVYDSIIHDHPSSAVFEDAAQFSAPLGFWNVSNVTDMRYSEFNRACDIVRCSYSMHDLVYVCILCDMSLQQY